MIPILFDDGEKNFNTNGIGRLSECVSCTVTEERNGIYECEFQYPITGIHYDDIEEGRYVYATHDDTGIPQAFEIYAKTAPIDGIVMFYGRHISYGLNKTVVMPFTATSITDAITKIPQRIPTSSSFTFWTDKTSIGEFKLTEPREVRAILGGSEGSLLDVYGKGDYEWDMFHVKLHQERGTDSDVEIRYGKNMSDITVETDAGDTYNAIVPFWKGTVDNREVVITLPEGAIIYDQATKRLAYLTDETLDILRDENGSPLEVFFRIYETVPIDMTDQFEEAPTEEQLRAAAVAYLNSSEGWVPTENITVDFVQMWQTEEYKEYAPLQKVRLCDTVSVYYPELGVAAVKKKVVKTTYNTLLDRYDKIELGDIQYSFGEIITGQIMQDVPTTSMMDDAIEHATQLISGGLGGYVIMKPNAAGKPEEILIMDDEDIDQAVNVIRMNKNGIGFSTSGYHGTYKTAWTIDGHFVADFITSGTLNANVIKAGVLGSRNGRLSINMETGIFSGAVGDSVIEMLDSGYPLRIESEGVEVFSVDSNGWLFVDMQENGSPTGAYLQMTNNNFTTVFGDSQLYLDNESAFISFSGSELYMDNTEVTLTGANGAYVTANYDSAGLVNRAGDVWISVQNSDIILSLGSTISTAVPNLRCVNGSNALRYTSHANSSRKVKRDITKDIIDDIAPEKLYDVEIVQFRYKEGYVDPEDSRADIPLLGFIIEDLNEIYPNAVDRESDDSKDWGWNATYIIPPMLKLIQDQKKEIEVLKDQMSVLQDEITEIKEAINADN